MIENKILREKLLKLISKKNISPFKNNIKIISLPSKEIPLNINKNFFEENFSSNFISNFKNPINRNIFVNTIKSNLNKNNNNNHKNKNFYLKNLQKHLNKNLCKNENNQIENPNCLFCLKDIKLNEIIYFLKCGHIFHLNCFNNYIKDYNNFICPFCKYDFSDDILIEDFDDIIIKDITYKENNIPNFLEERINLFF